VRRNRRSGVSGFSAHAVRSENGEAGASECVTLQSSPASPERGLVGANDRPICPGSLAIVTAANVRQLTDVSACNFQRGRNFSVTAWD
jgi:hypothetical protein